MRTGRMPDVDLGALVHVPVRNTKIPASREHFAGISHANCSSRMRRRFLPRQRKGARSHRKPPDIPCRIGLARRRQPAFTAATVPANKNDIREVGIWPDHLCWRSPPACSPTEDPGSRDERLPAAGPGASLSGMSRHGAIRASDADRDQVVDRLHHATTEGRVASEELEHRVSVALKAKTYSELEAIVADWRDPVTIPGRARAPPLGRRLGGRDGALQPDPPVAADPGARGDVGGRRDDHRAVGRADAAGDDVRRPSSPPAAAMGPCRSRRVRPDPRPTGPVGRGAVTRLRPSLEASNRSAQPLSPSSSTARNASWGTSIRPTCFIRCLPFFCCSSSLRLRLMSPP